MMVTRSSPILQRLQSAPPYIDIYSDASPSPLRQSLLSSPEPEPFYTSVPSVAPRELLTHAHPAPARWNRPCGYGARHMHDKAPFSLWDEQERRFQAPKRDEKGWMFRTFDAVCIGRRGYYMWIETDNPPQPIPLTVACMPVLFVAVGEEPDGSFPNAGHYANPRLPDPCPYVSWPRLSNPKRAERISVLDALRCLMNPQAVIYLPSYTVVELVHNDGHIYEAASLPGTVAGRSTLYHHSAAPFFDSMKDLKRERRLDPASYQVPPIGPLPEDYTNYLLQPTNLLTPGVRIASGRGAPGTSHQSASLATTAGVRLRNSRGQDFITVANHGFLFSTEVYHPGADENGVKIGDVIQSRPELDIALVQLTPSNVQIFSNHVYFQAEPPRQLVGEGEIIQGSWSEVDGMSSGLVSMMSLGCGDYSPTRPSGHVEISFSRWRTFNISQIFGAVNRVIINGMCGAPIVGCDHGDVQGFFHLGSGQYAQSATLDDLIAEGWAIV